MENVGVVGVVVLGVVLIVWAILWFMVPFHISEIAKNLKAIRLELQKTSSDFHPKEKSEGEPWDS